MALARIKMVAIKDFSWEKHAGKWTMQMCPLGQGMVDWPKFFSVLAGSGFSGPISLHVEYEPSEMIGAITRDFAFLRKQVDQAFGGLS